MSRIPTPAEADKYLNSIFDLEEDQPDTQEIKIWENPIHQKFKKQAESAGYEVKDYNGRYGYYGPAVFVRDNDEFQEFLQNTKTQIKLQWDSLGKTCKVIYPK